jgi:hypothetical protein
MKISELILDLAEIYGKEGDIDVICVVPVSPDCRNEPPNRENCTIETTTPLDRKYRGITTDKYLHIGMDV